MRTTYRVLYLVLAGVLGGYFGYWLGDLAGWSTDAKWPFTIGGGPGAIATSIALAVGAVIGTAALLRRHAPPGVDPASLHRSTVVGRGTLEGRFMQRHVLARGYRWLVLAALMPVNFTIQLLWIGLGPVSSVATDHS